MSHVMHTSPTSPTIYRYKILNLITCISQKVCLECTCIYQSDVTMSYPLTATPKCIYTSLEVSSRMSNNFIIILYFLFSFLSPYIYFPSLCALLTPTHTHCFTMFMHSYIHFEMECTHACLHMYTHMYILYVYTWRVHLYVLVIRYVLNKNNILLSSICVCC